MRLVFAAILASAPLPGLADYTLNILHTNDVHARFEPINRFNSTCSVEDNAAGACFGGTARLATAIEAARDAAENPLLLDGGDQFQGTLFYTYYKGLLAAEMMNTLGYDAMVVGNHEFDDGPEVLRAFINSVTFPVLMANADVSREEQLSSVIKKSTVIERGGERLGLIGLTPQDNGDLAKPGPNITFTDPVNAVQAEVDALTQEGVNKIILLSHSGYDIDVRVAQETTGVDVIIGGHSHTYLDNADTTAAGPYPSMVGNTAIVQAFAYGKYLGHLDVVFDDEGEILSAEGGLQLLDASVAEDPTIVARITKAAKPLEEIRNRVVAEAETPIGAGRSTCRSSECEMGNLVADAMLARVAAQGVEVALMNGGGLRAAIDEGPITMGEVLTVLPFQNTLSTFRIDGATLLQALENGVSQYGEGAGRFPQVAGMAFSFDPDAKADARIVDATVNGVALDPEQMYFVVSNDYMRNGGDGYDMLRTAQDAYDFGPDLADVVAEYLAENSPYTPVIDGRIRNIAE